MNLRTTLAFLAVFLSIKSVLAESISGTVDFKGKQLNGTLFVFAKKHDGSMPMPLAVKKIPSPKFPYQFELSDADKMMPSIPFEGPFVVIARLSPSGSAMDKTGIEVSTTKPVKLGQKNIVLVLKNPKSKK